MYKRPTVFTSRGAAVKVAVPHVRPNSLAVTPGRVGDLITCMRQGPSDKRRDPRPWTPPYDYEFYAKFTDDPKAYLKKVAEWLEANPKPVPKACVDVHGNLNFEPIHKLFKKYNDNRPPLDEHVAALREAGYSDAKINKVIQHAKVSEETAEKRAEALDKVFAKWPSSSKPTPKVLKAPIKAVKKKMN